MQDKSAPLKQRHTAKRIFTRLQEEYPELLSVGYRSICRYVSEKKKELYKESRGYIPLSHPSGEAQVDFGKAMFYENDANFDLIKTFENYSFDQIEIPANITVEEIKAAAFLERNENLILYGPVGTGKTHLATAIGVAACNNAKRARFYRTAALVNDLIDAKATGTLKKLLNQFEKIDLLICDEGGIFP
ncbi:DNA replication protein [Peptoclostridium litorale DSM 5388]|uniref:DNA replication protein n=1 Tax=Peptoclostridium litorale DSM 5388 TaxID=1121324 RepID=A0A069RHW7_PEPLI|nr:ATP-binding protein [Peptoclostridium litorale]KDR96403.1 DNA replication protein [Peptoclostridium litorale DSM 5388]